MKKCLLALLLVLLSSSSYADRTRLAYTPPLTTVWVGYDSHDQGEVYAKLTALALQNGARNVSLSQSTDGRGIVFVRYQCGSCVFFPEPKFNTEEWPTVEQALSSYNTKTTTKGIFTTPQGTAVVYWQK